MDNEGWSDEEKAIVCTHWPKGQQQDIMRLLPRRTWTSIKQHANTRGIVRSKELKAGCRKVNQYYETISYADIEAAMTYAENGEDKAYMCEKVNELAEQTPRGFMSVYWPLPVDIVGFSSFVSDEGGSSSSCSHF